MVHEFEVNSTQSWDVETPMIQKSENFYQPEYHMLHALSADRIIQQDLSFSERKAYENQRLQVQELQPNSAKILPEASVSRQKRLLLLLFCCPKYQSQSTEVARKRE